MKRNRMISESRLSSIIRQNINEETIHTHAVSFASHMVNEAIYGSCSILALNENRGLITEGAWFNTLMSIALAAAGAIGYNMSNAEAAEIVQNQIEQTGGGNVSNGGAGNVDNGYTNRFDREAQQGVNDARQANANRATTWAGKRAEERNLNNKMDQSSIARGERDMNGNLTRDGHKRMEDIATQRGNCRWDRINNRFVPTK